MTAQFRSAPKFEQPLQNGEENSAWWYRYFQAQDVGMPPSSETVVTVTASPFVYEAPRKGYVIVNGGTVSKIEWERVGTFWTTGQTQGMVSVNQLDRVRITYSAKPTVVFVPS